MDKIEALRTVEGTTLEANKNRSGASTIFVKRIALTKLIRYGKLNVSPTSSEL